jgi:hypothetical protein
MNDYVCHAYKPPHTASSTLSSPSSGILYPISDFVNYDKFSASHSRFLYAVTSTADPTTYLEASKHDHWRAAMSAELHALEQNGTWEMSSLPPGKKAIGSKWVFRTKYNQTRLMTLNRSINESPSPPASARHQARPCSRCRPR